MFLALVIFMVFCFSFQTLFTKLYTASYQGPDDSLATPTFSISYGLIIGIATLAVGGFTYAPSWPTFLMGVFNAGMLILFNSSMINACSRGSYSFLMIASMFGAILMPVVVAALFLGEQISLMQGSGIVLMLISLVAMNARSISFKGNSGAYYFWCGMLFLSNGLYSTVTSLQANLLNGLEHTEMVATVYLCCALASAAAQLIRGGKTRLVQGFQMGKKAAVFMVLAAVFAGLGANIILYVLTRLNSSVTIPISNGGNLVLSAIYSAVLFREKLTWDKLLGIVFAIASIVMISI